MKKIAGVFRAVLMVAPILVGVGSADGAKAQESSANQQPTVQDILRQIEKNGDFSIDAARADIKIADARRDAARAALYPRLTLSATGQLFRPSADAFRNEHRELYGGLEVVQPIYDFGKTASNVKAANKGREAAAERLLSVRNAVLMEGMALFFNLQASELEVRALYENHSAAYVRWERSKEMLKLGRSDPVEVAKKLARVEQTRLQYYRERDNNVALRLQLRELTGNFIEQELISPLKPPKLGPPDVDRQKFAKKVVLKNPQLKALIRQAEAKGILRGGIVNRPSVEAFGDIGKTSRELRGRNDYAIGARLSWPIFDGGINRSRRSLLAAEESRINAAIGSKRSQLRIAAHKAILRVQESYQQVVAARAKLDYTTRILLRRQQLYQQERVTDLGQAMIENTTAEAGVVRATGIYYLDLARVAVLLGLPPGRAMEANFLSSLGIQSGAGKAFSPKSGSGFGQKDQDNINRQSN